MLGRNRSGGVEMGTVERVLMIRASKFRLKPFAHFIRTTRWREQRCGKAPGHEMIMRSARGVQTKWVAVFCAVTSRDNPESNY